MRPSLWQSGRHALQRIGHLQSQVVLLVLYIVLVGPVAICIKLFKDPLNLRRPRVSNWRRYTLCISELHQARRQS